MPFVFFGRALNSWGLRLGGGDEFFLVEDATVDIVIGAVIKKSKIDERISTKCSFVKFVNRKRIS